MASPSLPFGPRISDDEYDRRVVALHTSAAGHGKDRDREVRRAELNLAVDHRLGQNFPADRRRMLWEAQERIERRRRRLALRSLWGLMRSRSSEGAADSLARELIRAYAEVLTRDELEAFFGDAAGDELPRSSAGKAWRA
jgi:acyl-CoA reductase-like NAD-dependent aldehyde dehydrogenase